MNFTPSQSESLTRRRNITRHFRPGRDWNLRAMCVPRFCKYASIPSQLPSAAAQSGLSWSSRIAGGATQCITGSNPLVFESWLLRTRHASHFIGSLAGSSSGALPVERCNAEVCRSDTPKEPFRLAHPVFQRLRPLLFAGSKRRHQIPETNAGIRSIVTRRVLGQPRGVPGRRENPNRGSGLGVTCCALLGNLSFNFPHLY